MASTLGACFVLDRNILLLLLERLSIISKQVSFALGLCFENIRPLLSMFLKHLFLSYPLAQIGSAL